MGRNLLLVTSQARSVHSGVGTYANLLLDGIRGRCPDDTRITVATWSEETDAARLSGLSWLDLGPQSGWDPSPEGSWSLGRRLVRVLEQRFDTCPYDTVFFLDARQGHAFFRSRLYDPRVEVIGTVHDDYAAQSCWNPLQYLGASAEPLRDFAYRRWLRRLEARSFPRFDLLLVNSKATGEAVRSAYSLDPGRLVPVRLTVADLDVDPAGVRLDGRPALLFAGGDFYRKGLDTLIQALGLLRAGLPDIRLHVAGRCRSQARIEQLVQRQGLEDFVRFHGQVEPEQLGGMFAAADLFVMPARTEALGLVYLEAFRAGLPVIAGDRGGVTELVQDRKSGVLVTPGCVEALAEAIREVLLDHALRHQVIAGGFEILAERRPGRLVAETLAVLGLQDVRGPEPEPSGIEPSLVATDH